MEKSETAPEVTPCPFCGEQPYPIADMRKAGDGRYIECRCNLYLYRHRCYVDDQHSRLEINDEIDADLIKRWNRRTVMKSATTAA